MSADPTFALSGSVKVEVDHVGREREPLLVVDDVLEAPQSLVDYAASEVRFEPAWSPSGGYPGISAPAPLNYVGRLVRSLDPMLRRAFGLGSVKLANAQCRFSMVTLAPGELAPSQQVPHVDTTDPLQFALLHYLCGEEHGGTAFYRHRATGFERLTQERMPAYREVRAVEGEPPAPAGYIVGDTAHFERIGLVEARYNRLAVYRSHLLHSGLIPSGRTLSVDPRTGRLTANIFVNYRPA